jgi:hypothetical protein
MKKRIISILPIIFVFALAQFSSAVIYPFEIFTDNGPYWDDPGMDCYVDVTNGGGTVDFTFYNASTVDCAIAAVYFDDGSLLGISNIINGPGVEFTDPAKSADLPAGNTLDPPFETTADFSAKGVQPPPFNGVNNTLFPDDVEWVTITFDLINGGTLQDVLNELNTGQLRIGIHITSFPDGSSESAVNVPEPATLCLLAFGGLVLCKRRKT